MTTKGAMHDQVRETLFQAMGGRSIGISDSGYEVIRAVTNWAVMNELTMGMAAESLDILAIYLQKAANNIRATKKCEHERTRMDDGISSCLDCGDRIDTDQDEED